MAKKLNRVEYEAVEGIAARAMYQAGRGLLPRIRFDFKVNNDTIIVMEMDLADAGKFVQHAIIAIQAATPPIPRPAGNQFFD